MFLEQDLFPQKSMIKLLKAWKHTLRSPGICSSSAPTLTPKRG